MTTIPLFMAAALALLLAPGPAVLYIVTRSVDQGRRAGLASVAGIELANCVHVLAATLGLSAILASSALVFNVVRYLGAAYLIYLGVRKLISKEQTGEAEVAEPSTLRKIFSQGIIVNLLNPKTALFFFAFLPQFVDSSKGSPSLQVLILGLIFVTMGTITDSTYALLAGTAGPVLKNNARFLAAQRYIAGVVYIGLGLTAALAGENRK